MQVQAIAYEPTVFPDELYQRALLLLDAKSSARIKRFYHPCIQMSSSGTLIGRFLPRMLLHGRGIALADMKFAATEAGKPFIATLPAINGVDPPIAYNISHDNGLVAIVSSANAHNPPAFTIGIDVMKIRIPSRDNFEAFIESMSDQLTAVERHVVEAAPSQAQGLEWFFWMWTAKEAYTKALGLGLGFDFRRVEFDPTLDVFRVDGVVPQGWQLSKFKVIQGAEIYLGVVAEFVGGSTTVVVPESHSHEWLSILDATSFVRTALQQLNS
ncbi:hypothetical protein C8R43DRAFT_901970 [Mycena crocata]|nr:hypothetical protein C8R43DRAFT_901970 [Mycena crocata]